MDQNPKPSKRESSVVRRITTVPGPNTPTVPGGPILIPADPEVGTSGYVGPVLETMRPTPPEPKKQEVGSQKKVRVERPLSLEPLRLAMRPLKKGAREAVVPSQKEGEVVDLESEESEDTTEGDQESSKRTRARRRRARRQRRKEKKEKYLSSQRVTGTSEVAGPEGAVVEDDEGRMVYVAPGAEIIRADGFFSVCPAPGSNRGAVGLSARDFSRPGTSAQAYQETVPKGGESRSMEEQMAAVFGTPSGGEGKKRKAEEMVEVHHRILTEVDGGKDEGDDIRRRDTEAAIGKFFRYDRRPYPPVVQKYYPERVDVTGENEGSRWYPLRVRAQKVKLRYYDFPAYVTQEDDDTELVFYDLDIFLMYTFLRLQRVRYYPEFQKTERRSEEKVCDEWWLRYGDYLKGLKKEEDLMVWKEASFIMACAFVLRRAFKEDALRTALLSLGVHTEVKAFSMVLGERYGEVLLWVRMALLGRVLPAHPSIHTRYLVGDSLVNRWVVSVRSREDRERSGAGTGGKGVEWRPGIINGFRVLSLRGADVRTGAWLTQCIMLPNTEAVVWELGTNNVEAAPLESRDDRTPEEKRKGPSRLDRKGRVQFTNYRDVVFTLMYHGRLVSRVHPGLQRLFIMELLPRFSDAPEVYGCRLLEGHDRQEPKRVRKMRDLNRLLRELVAKQKKEKMVALAAYDQADDPEYCRLGEGSGIGLKMWDHRRMWAILHRVTTIAAGLLE